MHHDAWHVTVCESSANFGIQHPEKTAHVYAKDNFKLHNALLRKGPSETTKPFAVNRNDPRIRDVEVGGNKGIVKGAFVTGDP